MKAFFIIATSPFFLTLCLAQSLTEIQLYSGLENEDPSLARFQISAESPSSIVNKNLLYTEYLLLIKKKVEAKQELDKVKVNSLTEDNKYYYQILRSIIQYENGQFKEANTTLEALDPIFFNWRRLQGLYFLRKGLTCAKLLNYNCSLEALGKSQRIYRQDSVYCFIKLAKVYYHTGSVLFLVGKYDSAILCINRSVEIFRNNPFNKQLELSRAYNNVGNVYQAQGDYSLAKLNFENSLEIQENELHDTVQLVITTSSLARFYSDYGNLLKSKEMYERCVRYVKESNTELLYYLPSIYNNYASFLKSTSENVNAKTYYSKALDFAISDASGDRLRIVIYLNLAWLAHADRQVEEAFMLLNIIEPSVLSKYNNDSEIITPFYRLKGDLALDKNETVEAEKFYRKAMALATENAGVLKDCLRSLGGLAASTDQYQSAKGYFHNALQTAQSILPEFSDFYCSVYNDLGALYLKENVVDSAEFYFQKSLSTNVLVQNSLSEYEGRYIDPFNMLVSNYYLVSIALANYSKHKTDAEKLAEYEKYIILSKLIITKRKQDISSEDQLQFSKLTKDFFDQAIEYYYQLYSATKSKNFIEKAFEISEMAKQQVLLRILRSSKINQYAGVTKSIEKHESALASDLSLMESQIAQELAYGEQVNTDLLQEYQHGLNGLQQKYSLYMDSLQQHLPDYYNLKFNSTLVTLQQVKNDILTKDKGIALLEYYIADSAAFCTVATNTESTIIKIPIEAHVLQRYVTALRNLAKLQMNNELIAQSKELYTILFEEINRFLLPKKIEQLLIITDGYTSQIPFELLVSASGDDWASSKTLLNDFAISYGYSSTLLWQHFSGTKTFALSGSRFLALAPDFESKQNADENEGLRSSHEAYDFAPLQGNVTEVKQIQATLRGKNVLADVLVGDDAHENNFKSKDLYKYDIIHLATHGFVNTKDEELSGIAFSRASGQTQDDILFMDEVFQLSSNAKLVCLSACETGYGKIERGEGIISLSRAFQFAGAKNMVVSLWKVDDASTTLLMNSFYKGLAKNKSISQALRAAKLQMLKTEKYQHPFMWSSFIHIGLN